MSILQDFAIGITLIAIMLIGGYNIVKIKNRIMETTLIRIKNNYAQEQSYEDWRELQEYHSRNPRGIESHMNEICIRAQKALKHPIYAKIDHYKELAEKHKDDAYNNRKYTYKAAGLEDALRIITNEENLIR